MIQPIVLPAQVDWVWFAVAGGTWPEANEDEIQTLAEQWQRVVEALGDGQQPLAADLAGVTSTYGGATGQEFRFASYDLLGYGGDSGLLPLQQAARDRQLAAQLGAMEFGLTKASMNLEVIVTAISVLYAIIMASISLGASGASIPALVAAGRNRAMQLAGDLVRRLGSREGFRRLTREGARAAVREGMQEVGEEGVIAAGGQAWQIATGQRGWGDVDLGRIALASGAGFAGGTGGTMIFGSNFAGLGNLYRIAQLRELSGRRFRDLLVPGAIRFGEGIIHNPVASGVGTAFSWLATGRDGNLWQMLRDGALSAAVVGGTRASLTLGGGWFGGRLNPVQYDPQTGLFAPRAGGPWDLSIHPDRAPQIQDILIQANLPAGATAVGGGEPAGVPASAVDGNTRTGDLPSAGDGGGRQATLAGAAGPPGSPDSSAALLTNSPPDQPRQAWHADVDQTVRRAFDGLPLEGHRQLQVEYAVPSERGTLVGMTIVDSDGSPVGSMTRMFGQDPNGTPYVAHINTVLSGGGDHHLGTPPALDPNLQSAYRGLGFDQVRLLPGAGDGAVAAADGAGFAPGAGDAVARMRGELVQQLDWIGANRDQALDATLAGWLGVLPDQPATETQRQVAELLLDSQVAAAEDLLARMPESAWQPTPQDLLATGILGVNALNSVAWSVAVPLAPSDSPGGRPAPGAAWSATAAWLDRPDVHNGYDGRPDEFQIIDGRVWLVEPGAASADRTVVTPPGEALEVAHRFVENPDLGYLVRPDGLVVAGREMALALLAEAVRASAEPATDGAAATSPEPERQVAVATSHAEVAVATPFQDAGQGRRGAGSVFSVTGPGATTDPERAPAAEPPDGAGDGPPGQEPSGPAVPLLVRRRRLVHELGQDISGRDFGTWRAEVSYGPARGDWASLRIDAYPIGAAPSARRLGWLEVSVEGDSGRPLVARHTAAGLGPARDRRWWGELHTWLLRWERSAGFTDTVIGVPAWASFEAAAIEDADGHGTVMATPEAAARLAEELYRRLAAAAEQFPRSDRAIRALQQRMERYRPGGRGFPTFHRISRTGLVEYRERLGRQLLEGLAWSGHVRHSGGSGPIPARWHAADPGNLAGREVSAEKGVTPADRFGVARLVWAAVPAVEAALRQAGLRFDAGAVEDSLRRMVSSLAVLEGGEPGVRAELVRDPATGDWQVAVSLAEVEPAGGSARPVTLADLATAVVHELTHVLQGPPDGSDPAQVRDREVIAHQVEGAFLGWLRRRAGGALPVDLAAAASWEDGLTELVVHEVHPDGSDYLAGVADGSLPERSSAAPGESGRDAGSFPVFWQDLTEQVRLEARRRGTSPQHELQQFTLQRVLARIFTATPDAWILKGGQAMLARNPDARPSTDIDLVRISGGGKDAMIADYTAALRLELGDHLQFVPDPAATTELNHGAGVRLVHTVYSGGRELMRLSVDLNPPRGRPVWQEPDILPFPEQVLRTGHPGEAPNLRVISLQDTLAHKVSGMFTYGYRTIETRCADCLLLREGLFKCRAAGSELPYRPQDLADVLLIALSSPWDAAATHAMLHEEFAWRQQQGEFVAVPERFEIPNPKWFQSFTSYVDATPGLSYSGIGDALPLARAFLDPLLGRETPAGYWDPRQRRWTDQPPVPQTEVGQPPAPAADRPVAAPATAIQLNATGQASPSTAFAAQEMSDRWTSLAAGPAHPGSLDFQVAALKSRTDMSLAEKIEYIRERLMPEVGYEPTRVPGLDSKNLRFYVHQRGELYGHSAALILDPETTVELAFRPNHTYEAHRQEAYSSYMAYLDALPDDMDAEDANAVIVWRALNGRSTYGVDPDELAGDLIDIHVQPLRDALALRQRLIDDYRVEPHRIRLAFAGRDVHFTETRWMRAQLFALSRIRADPAEAREAMVDALLGRGDARQAREARIRAATERLYAATDRAVERLADSHPDGPEKYALLWVRNSLGQGKDLVYGAARDTRPEFVRQTIEMMRETDPDRRIVLIGDDLFAHRPELREAWAREGVLNSVDTETMVTFWDPAHNDGQRLSQAEQTLVFHRLSTERDVVQIGVFSGALEMAALVGMPTVYFEPGQFDGTRGKRLQLYWTEWAYGATEMVRDERGDPTFDQAGRPIRRFRPVGDPLPPPLATIRRVLHGTGHDEQGSSLPGQAGADYAAAAQIADRINRLVDGGDLAQWSRRLGSSAPYASDSRQAWDEPDWAKSRYYADQLHRWLHTEATTPAAAGRKWDAIRLALIGVLEPGFHTDQASDRLTAAHPYSMLHTDSPVPADEAARIEQAYATAPAERGHAVAHALEHLLGDPEFRRRAVADQRLFQLSPSERGSLRRAFQDVIAARDAGARGTRAPAASAPPADHPAASVQVIVIAKEPVPGRVKTRMTPPYTFGQGAEIARASLTDTLNAVAATPFARRVLALAGEPGPWLPPGVEVIAQHGGGLDERLAHAFAAAYAGLPSPMLIIGMDTPQVTPELLTLAAAALQHTDAVFGPATDGGYWLLGLRHPDPRLLMGVPMSQPDTGAVQLERLHRAGLSVTVLPALTDVDTVVEASAVAAEAPDGLFGATIRDRVGPGADPLQQAVQAGGFSWSPTTGAPPADGYMVAVSGHTARYPEEILTDPERFAVTFREYLLANWEVFENHPDAYLGGWIADGQLWLDVSRNILDREEAIRAGRAGRQVAVYDVKAGEHINIGGGGGDASR